MAQPRVFISSTYYDLKHIRSSLELFIESLGYEPMLSEKGDIAYHPDMALDESCYREVTSCDIFVIVIGGRYGSEVSGRNHKTSRDFFDQYDSITRREYETAIKADVPIYILIDSAVHAEYQTYLKNRDNINISYAHVDSVNVFKLIEFILSQPRNNPVYNFTQSSQIEVWLREQWAGLFREMMRSRSQQRQLSALAEQISELKIANGTLKDYLETVVQKVDPDKSSQLIEREDQRIRESVELKTLMKNDLFDYIVKAYDIDAITLRDIFSNASDLEDIFDMIPSTSTRRIGQTESDKKEFLHKAYLLKDANDARKILNRPPFTRPSAAKPEKPQGTTRAASATKKNTSAPTTPKAPPKATPPTT